jgi:hypothetical protein
VRNFGDRSAESEQARLDYIAQLKRTRDPEDAEELEALRDEMTFLNLSLKADDFNPLDRYTAMVEAHLQLPPGKRAEFTRRIEDLYLALAREIRGSDRGPRADEV